MLRLRVSLVLSALVGAKEQADWNSMTAQEQWISAMSMGVGQRPESRHPFHRFWDRNVVDVSKHPCPGVYLLASGCAESAADSEQGFTDGSVDGARVSNWDLCHWDEDQRNEAASLQPADAHAACEVHERWQRRARSREGH